MSSVIPRRQRERRQPRASIEDFSVKERDIIDAARSWFPGPIVVFGSRARGDWADDSDIDLGVTGYEYRLHKQVKKRLTEYAGISVDLARIEAAYTHRSGVTV